VSAVAWDVGFQVLPVGVPGRAAIPHDVMILVGHVDVAVVDAVERDCCGGVLLDVHAVLLHCLKLVLH
jgi:hypothetical protein